MVIILAAPEKSIAPNDTTELSRSHDARSGQDSGLLTRPVATDARLEANPAVNGIDA
jgi:hypothetical protein